MDASKPTIYHLAEVRLGGAFPFLGQAGAGHRRHIRDAFERAVDQGLDLDPSLVLISGNLFGTPFPSRDLADFAREQIGRFASRGIPVLVAAGPLDALYERTYAAGALADLERVTVFQSMARPVDLPELNLCVVGASWSASPAQPVHADFLATLASHRKHRHLIGAAHLELPETDEGIKALRRQIAVCGASYLALGGSPVRRDLSSERVAAWCPGGPEPVAPDPGEGSPLLVAVGDTLTVTPHPINKRRFARFTLQPSKYESHDDLVDAVRALAGPGLAARVQFAGPSRVNQFIDVADLQTRLADAFLALEIVDESTPALDMLQAAGYPDLSVAGKFLGVVLAEVERAATPEARWRAGAALRLGLSLLEGRRPS
jgi:hypothetical protein